MGAIERVFRGRRGGQERPAAAIVAGLWRNGEQGVWYDPSDLSTMFQDVAGGVPVYMPGQGQPDCWVGLQLDKRFGLTRGPSVVTNGSFSSPDGWTLGENFSVSAGMLRKAAGAGTLYVNTTQACLVVGRWYEVTLTISSITTDQAGVSGATFSAVPGASRLRSTPGLIKFIGQATSALLYLTARQDAAADIDDVSIRELPGNHRWQGTATSRPVLSARYNLVNQSEGVSTPDWSKFVGGTASAPVVTENFALSPRGDMTADRVVISRGAGTSSGDYSLVSVATGTMATAVRTIRSVWMKSNTGATQNVALYDDAQNVGGAVTVTPEWKQFFLTGGTVVASSSLALGSRGGDVWFSNSQADLDICVWGADIRAEGDGIGLPSYQRVADASNYDTVGFPLYIRADGADDWMQTSSVDFSGTDKVTFAAAIRKLSDAGIGVFVELSPVYTTPGTFAVFAPAVNAVPEVSFGLNGGISSGQLLYRAALYTAPITTVALALFNISGASREAQIVGRFNGVTVAATSWSKGSPTDPGTLGNYPLYFFRRGGASYPFGGRDYGTIIVGRLLTGPETAAVEKLLRQKSKAY